MLLSLDTGLNLFLTIRGGRIRQVFVRHLFLLKSLLTSCFITNALFSPLLWAETSSLNKISITPTQENLPRHISDSIPDETASKTTIIKQKVFAGKATTLAEVLQTQAGIKIRQVGGLGTFSDISIRGATAKQVMVYIDGVPLNSANGFTVDLSQIPLDNIEQIEIYRGNAPIQFAQQAQGGVINLRTKRDSGNNSTVSAMLGSFGAKKLALTNNGSNQKWQHLLSLSHQRAENDFGYLSDNGTHLNEFDDFNTTRNNSQTQLSHALFKLGYQLSASQKIHSQVSLNESVQHIPTLDNDATNNTFYKTQTLNAQLSYQSNAVQKSDWATQSSLFVSNKKDRYQPQNLQTKGIPSDYDTNAIRLQHFAEKPFKIIRLNSIAKLSLDLQNESYKTQAPDSFLFPNGQINNLYNRQLYIAGIEWFTQTNDEVWAIIPAIKIQNLQDKNKKQLTGDSALNETDITRNLGIIYQPTYLNNTQIKANIGNNIRQPTFAEKYANMGWVIGNPNLSKETGINRDISIEAHGKLGDWIPNSYISLAGFYNDINDVIVQTYNAQGIGRSINLANATLWGSEFETGLSTKFGQSFSLNLTYQQSKVLSDNIALDDTKLPNQPTAQLSFYAEQKIQNYSVFYQFHYESGSYYDHTNLLPIKTKRLHDIGLRYQTKALSIALEAHNLLDQNFEIFNGFPSPGRAFYLTLQTNF